MSHQITAAKVLLIRTSSIKNKLKLNKIKGLNKGPQWNPPCKSSTKNKLKLNKIKGFNKGLQWNPPCKSSTKNKLYLNKIMGANSSKWKPLKSIINNQSLKPTTLKIIGVPPNNFWMAAHLRRNITRSQLQLIC